MTKEQVLEVIQLYRNRLEGLGIKANSPDFDFLPEHYEQLEHLLTMIEPMESFLNADVEKAMRWLGFMQGVLWSQGHFTLNEMRDHNRGKVEE
jgi:hypothetical protein